VEDELEENRGRRRGSWSKGGRTSSTSGKKVNKKIKKKKKERHGKWGRNY
jgi:hypothetical protein